VNIDEPREHHYGGVVAAPVFKRIAEASLDYLHVHRPPVVAEGDKNPRQPRPDEAATPAGMIMPPPPAVTAFGGRMPELRGLSLRSAMRALDGCNCEVEVDGSGYVVDQRPEPGAEVSAAAAVRVVLARAGEK
jgi:cell division protein FtsI (penicillin-binding protein 3)